MPTAYIYTRVSTAEQNLSPEWQSQVCTTYYETALKHSGYAFGGVFHDHGESAYHIDWRERTQGRELFAKLQPGDIIVVAKMCRAFRSLRDRENVLHFLNGTRVDIAILDAMLDTRTAAGRFAAGVIALQVQWESDVRSERTKAAHMIRQKKKSPSNANPPPGWKYSREAGELVPDWEERKMLADIYEARRQKTCPLRESHRRLAANNTRRANGKKYYHCWLTRAYSRYLRGWPREGYMVCRAGGQCEVPFLRKKRTRPSASASPASQPTASQPDGC